MAAARYWRLVGIETYAGGDLELSEVALYNGALRIDGSATLTCSHAPIAGTLADLKDGSTSTACSFAGADVRSAGFYLQWDFGSDAEVTELKLGASSSAPRFMAAGTLLQGASVGVWSYVAEFSGAVYPGAGSLTESTDAGAIPTTWNPMDKGSNCTLSNGNLSGTAPAHYGSVRSVYGAYSGKWYWEITTDSYYPAGIGVATPESPLSNYPGYVDGQWAWFANEGNKYTGGVSSSYGPAGSIVGIVIGVALDMDAKTIALYRDGVALGTMYSGLPAVVHAICGGSSTSSERWTANFGATPFAFAPPAGFTAGFGAYLMSLPVTSTPAARTVRSGFFIAASAPVPAHTTAFAPRLQLARDVEVGGQGTIYGTTKTAGAPNAPGTPTKARVVLLHQRSKLPVRETWSDPVTGNYAFVGIDTSQQFLVLAEDAAGNFRPVAANRLTPEVQP